MCAIKQKVCQKQAAEQIGIVYDHGLQGESKARVLKNIHCGVRKHITNSIKYSSIHPFNFCFWEMCYKAQNTLVE